jgi:hypothetical protein
MTVWDEYFARYRDLPVWSPETAQDGQYKDRCEAMEENLIADFSAHCPPSSPEEIAWFRNALEHEEEKFFAAWVLREPREIPETLYEPMIRAGVHERNPSMNRVFVQPCLAAFGLRRVNETLLEFFENGSEMEKAGAVQAMYWASMIRRRDSDRQKPEARAWFEAVGDLWMRQRCRLLREFVSNPSVVVRQRIVPHLDLRNASSYPDEFQPLVPKAIQIARSHADDYIRHRIEIQMGTSKTPIYSPLPAMSQSKSEILPESENSAPSGKTASGLVARLKSLLDRFQG